jgi:hypothetical protein
MSASWHQDKIQAVNAEQQPAAKTNTPETHGNFRSHIEQAVFGIKPECRATACGTP